MAQRPEQGGKKGIYPPGRFFNNKMLEGGLRNISNSICLTPPAYTRLETDKTIPE